MIVQLPPEVFGAINTAFAIGILLGAVGMVYMRRVRENKVGTIIYLATVIFEILMVAGLILTATFSVVHQKSVEKETNTYIEKTTEELTTRLTQVSDVDGFNHLVKGLYDAEFTALEMAYVSQEDKTTIGELISQGESVTIGNYFDGLTTAERNEVLETSKQSLETFTVLDFAKLDTDIQTSSLKLGSVGNKEVKTYIKEQRGELADKVHSLPKMRDSIGKTFQAIIILNVGLALLALVLSVILYLDLVAIANSIRDEQNEDKDRDAIKPCQKVTGDWVEFGNENGKTVVEDIELEEDEDSDGVTTEFISGISEDKKNEEDAEDKIVPEESFKAVTIPKNEQTQSSAKGYEPGTTGNVGQSEGKVENSVEELEEYDLVDGKLVDKKEADKKGDE